MTMMTDEKSALKARVFAVIAVLFVIWGVALWLYNALFFKFTHFFELSATAIAWTLASFHFAYAALAVPAALFHRRFGYKLGILAGLSVFGIGAFLLYLAIIRHESLYFAAAVIVIGSCGAWLETSLNPLAVIAGKSETIVRRLNLMHAFNGLGLLIACVIAVSLLGKGYQISSGVTAQSSAQPYVLVGLGAILLAFLIEQVPLPDFAAKGTVTSKATSDGKIDLRSDIGVLLSDKGFLIAAAALFAYGIVLTLLWTANYRYHNLELPGQSALIIERGWFWFVIGRFAGVALMRWIDPARLLMGCTVVCLAAIAVTAAIGGLIGWIAMLSCSLFIAITYPTVFGTALNHSRSRLALAAGLLVIASGIGNGLSSLWASFVLDALGLNPRLVVVAALPFEAVVLWFALRSCGRHSPAAAHAAA